MTPTKSPEKRSDRRVIRTRKAIMDAFEKLICKNDGAKITVSALAREANIDRKTFYLHFNSIDDLATYRTELLIEQILDKLQTEGVGKTHLERIHITLTEANAIFTSNIPLYSNIALRLSTDQVIRHFISAAGPALERAGLSPQLENERQLYMEMQFFVAGTVSLYSSWLKSDRKEPIETISNTIEKTMGVLYEQEKATQSR